MNKPRKRDHEYEKRIISVLLAIAMLAFTFSGCGLFSNSGDNGGNSGGDSSVSNGDPLQITENYTVEAPEGVGHDEFCADIYGGIVF